MKPEPFSLIVQWDQEKMTIPNNEAARKAMHRPMRDPWNVLDPKFI